jgi:uncharacterized protein (DUF1800 family)
MASSLDSRARIARVLQRTGFGVRAEELDAAVADGFEATVAKVLSRGDDLGASATPPPDLGPLPQRGGGGRDGAVRTVYRQAVREQREKLTLWWLDRMTAVEQPWPEKLTVLWHNHWATSIQKVRSAAAMLAQNETLRSLGGGDFRTLARAMVCDPALMLWLDAAGNTADAPNENLARELMELFVLGVGNYSETDVRQAAAALTGWSVDRTDKDGWTARFSPRQHAGGPQTVLGTMADFTATALVDLLVARPESACHVATRFWSRLVSAESGPPRESLERITEASGASRDTTAMVRAMLTDPVFSDAGSVLVKQPVEYVVGTLRALDVRPAKLPERALLRALTGMGQVPFAPPNVGGWPAGTAWLTTSAARTRIAFAQQITRDIDLGSVEDASVKERPEALARLLGVRAWGEATAGALTSAATDPRRATQIALTAPEYLVLS